MTTPPTDNAIRRANAIHRVIPVNTAAWWLMLSVVSLTARPAVAQRAAQDPHLAYAYPAGCQQGTSCQVVLGGQFLKNVDGVYLAGEGVEVEIIDWYRPMTQGEYNNLRNALTQAREELTEKRKQQGLTGQPKTEDVIIAAGITREQEREMEIYRLRDQDPKRQPNEQLEEELTVKLTVARDAAPGKRELRMLTETSMSNPLWIHIGTWPEVRESETNDVVPDAAIDQLPLVVNGQIMPGDVDRFAFSASAGTRLVIQAGARDVIPFLADAVPGWFQAVLRLLDGSGQEVAFADSFHYRQDPVLYFEVPRDGEYTVEIRDTLYRGREDFVYRLTLGELPIVTSMFPLGARTDSEVRVELEGWNLSQTSLTVKTMSRRAHRPVRWFTVPQDGNPELRIPLQIDVLPEVFDQEPNNAAANAQVVTTRTIVNGRIDHPGDQDVFRIEGRGRLVAEVEARRHGSPLDSMLILTDEQGHEIAFNDDHEDKSQALATHHADSQLTALLPGTGPSFLTLRDAQQNGGKDFVYRLSLRAPEPDFELRVVPSSIIARPGAVVPITVFALREDNFNEEISLTLIDPPDGFELHGAVIPRGANRERLTLSVPADPPVGAIVLEMEGKARRGSGSVLSRPAVPAEHMMQAFIWYHLVPVEEWNVVISGRRATRPPFELQMPTRRLKLPVQGESIIPARLLNENVVASELHVELHEPPPGLSADIVAAESGQFALRLNIDAETIEPGWQGNLLLRAFREVLPAPTEANPAPQPQRTDYGYLPAIPIEVAGRKAAR